MITTYDVRWACDVMRPVYDATNGVDGRVSIEVDPRLAHETERTIAEAKALWWLVDRPNLYIKIPATEAGLPAITATLAEGISVNVTLIFGLDRYSQVMEAFLAGMEQARANGHDLSKIGSVASFFVSRVDTEVDKRLEKIGAGQAKALRARRPSPTPGWPTSATRRSSASERWQALADAGAHPQRPLWASTSHQEPRLPGRHLCRGADRAGHGEHHAGVGASTRSPTTARSAATPSPARTTRPGRSSTSSARRRRLSTTWWPRWSARAWRSSRRAGRAARRGSQSLEAAKGAGASRPPGSAGPPSGRGMRERPAPAGSRRRAGLSCTARTRWTARAASARPRCSPGRRPAGWPRRTPRCGVRRPRTRRGSGSAGWTPSGAAGSCCPSSPS